MKGLLLYKIKSFMGGIKTKKIISLLLGIFLILIFVACSTQQTNKTSSEQTNNYKNYNYTFKGKGENWLAVYTFKMTKKNGKYNSEEVIKLTYIGPDKQSVGKVESSFTLPDGDMSGSDNTLNSNGEIVMQGGGSSTVFPSLPQKDYIVKATVKWNGKVETFDLKNTST